jgi:anti-anti-sigma regulatory factor
MKERVVAMEGNDVTYRRRKSIGVLQLTGIVDIFEAADLHVAARRALEDSQAATVRLDMAQVKRMDASAAQILLVLKAAIISQGREFGVAAIAPETEAALSRLGIVL